MTERTARDRALSILQRVETQRAYATQLLDQVSREPAIDQRDRALIHQLVKGTLAQRGRIDALLNDLVKSGVDRLTPWIRNILRMGVYQILFLDRVPPEVAVNESVNLAKTYGHPGTVKLVNAVLRRVAARAPSLRSAAPESTSADDLAASYSHPIWLVRRWLQNFGAETTIALCEANNRPWPPCIRTNTLKIDTAGLRRRLDAEQVGWRAARYHPDCTILAELPEGARIHTLPSFREGLFLVQDESFALVTQLLDPRPGEFIVDLCSAPGGKTTHLAALMGNRGRIAAVDIHAHRLALVRENCERLGVTIVETIQADGRTVRFDQPADAILLDAPCSGTGVLGRRSDARWNKAEDELPRLRVLQQELLRQAATLLRPGGRIVYATCTLEPEENEGAVEAFLNSAPQFRRVAPGAQVPPELIDSEGYLRTWPHRDGIGGAFGALLVRSLGGAAEPLPA